ncbi:electron transfer flavoprotein subunit alpha/FixB family protein [Adlercreutzia sp. R21]|uniref:electron transfer flavoprotein subunit alpha/FixB family protein n=1 Tax=Adlercreutzia wanghongyangiae TaxID=3111451 RepID=UPI002DBDF55C|nr:electron transfer flavoprotein subunit alpha/FixB family protein [Adlercreutzia sp. R21]MEC4183264.1 electron transfer flavoprotein subunit alpha/FixB family protein [Adlercreutzia sp. R21]
MKSWIIAETPEGARALCSYARMRGDEVTLVAPGVEPVRDAADRILAIELPPRRPIDDTWASVAALIEQETPDIVLVEPTRSLKVVGGQLAAHFQCAAVGDVVEFDGDMAITMYYGGVAQRKSRGSGRCPIYFVSTSIADGIPMDGDGTVEEVSFVEPEHSLEIVDSCLREKSNVNLGAADVVVAGGRGFVEEADLDMLRAVASAIGAEVGCTRPLAEGVGWMPKESYIGVSGLMLAPKVYMGVGISGQMQHMVGVNRAQTVFAINKDKSAPIFKQCDWGIVGDLKTVLPALLQEL